MSESTEPEVVKKFREFAAHDEFPEDVKVTYRIAGGMPSERFEEEVVLRGSKQVNLSRRNMLDTAIPEEVSGELDQAEVNELLQQIGAGIDSLVTRSEARFLPDSLIGTITIEVNGEEETFYFLADEDERVAQEKPIAPEISQAIERINTVSRGLLEKDEGNDG
jgi:hypothetical protein